MTLILLPLDNDEDKIVNMYSTAIHLNKKIAIKKIIQIFDKEHREEIIRELMK